MNEQRKKSMYTMVTILQDLIDGKQIRVGCNVIAMDDEGYIGYLLQNDKGKTIAGDISVKRLAELIEGYEIVKGSG
jgi:hypothetical protein